MSWLNKWARSPRQDRRVVVDGKFVQLTPPPVAAPETEESALEVIVEQPSVSSEGTPGAVNKLGSINPNLYVDRPKIGVHTKEPDSALTAFGADKVYEEEENGTDKGTSTGADVLLNQNAGQDSGFNQQPGQDLRDDSGRETSAIAQSPYIDVPPPSPDVQSVGVYASAPSDEDVDKAFKILEIPPIPAEAWQFIKDAQESAAALSGASNNVSAPSDEDVDKAFKFLSPEEMEAAGLSFISSDVTPSSDVLDGPTGRTEQIEQTESEKFQEELEPLPEKEDYPF